MKTQAALQLFQYWNRLRDNTPAPSRTRIEPYDIRHVLSQTFILETERRDIDTTFRLVGTSISSIFCRPLRGTPLRDLFNEPQRPVLGRLARSCYQEQSVVLLGLDAATKTGRKTVLEMLMVPLQDETEGHRILGCLVPHKVEFWHGLEPISAIDIHSIRVVDPRREPMFLANRPEIALPPTLVPAEDTLEISNHEPRSRAPKLVVIQGGKTTK
ncbi:MAG: PAS domain-containing protein [Notoacmeibacter sp.]